MSAAKTTDEIETLAPEPASEVLVDAKGLGKKYRIFEKPLDRLKEALHPFGRSYHSDFFALKDLDLEVRRGEALAIVGRNGSGKSTLLKLVTGIVSPTEGTLAVRGRVAALLELGAGFNPEYTGIENVYLNGTIHGLTRAQVDARLDEILAFADIGDFAHRACKSYSSGMFARLAFAAMIHFEPDILIVDEALAVGDVFFQQKCNRYMKERMAGVTKLLVTHDLVSVAQLASRAIVLEKGRLAFDGDPLKAIEHYTKTLHTELFALPGRGEPASPDAPAREASWNAVDPSALGGAREVDIVGWSVAVDGAPPDLVRAGDTVRVRLRVKASRPVEHLIVGVTVSDKYGQAIFGVNSLGSGHGPIAIPEPGTKAVAVELEWPVIKEGTYFLTFGLGEGVEELNHVVQCWLHNVVAIPSIPGRAVHGIFDVPMRRVSVDDD